MAASLDRQAIHGLRRKYFYIFEPQDAVKSFCLSTSDTVMPHRLSDPVAIDIEKHYGDFRDQLFKDGYAVVKGAVPQERCTEYIERMTRWLEKFPLGFDRNDPSTWTEEHLPAHMKGGMYHGYAVGHEKFVWDARL